MSGNLVGLRTSDKPTHPHYVFDLTTVANNDGRMTGIPRTEFSLAKSLRELLGNEIEFILYSNVRKDFFRVPPDCLDDGSFKRHLHVVNDQEEHVAPAQFDLQAGESFSVFTCGGAWLKYNLDFVDSLISFVRSHQAKLCVMIHDLIPNLFPYWIDPSIAALFDSSLSILLQQVDLVACISRNTQRDLLKFCENQGLIEPESVAIRLGDQPGNCFDSYFGMQQPEEVAAIEMPFLLAVGGIQKRKNYELLFAAWKKLISSNCTVPRLVIVGGCIVRGHEILRMFLEDKEIARHVLIMPGVSDGQLEWLYKNAMFTMYPSLYEGWGLPVCESFRLGKICLASDNSSLPEILPGYPELLSANNADLWAARIAHFTNDAAARLELETYIKQNYQPHSWQDTARDLRDCLRALSESGKPGRSQIRPTLEVGNRIDFSQLKSANCPSTGWNGHETWGRWARGPRAGISLAIEPKQTDEKLCLILRMKCSRPQAVNILLNGELRETCQVGLALQNYICPLSKQDLASGNLDIVLETAEQSPQPIAAKRAVVGISQLALERISSLLCPAPLQGRRRGGRLLISDQLKSLIVGVQAGSEARTGSSHSAGTARAADARDDREQEGLTPWERLRESHEKYLHTTPRAREYQKQLRKLPRQIQYRLGNALVRAIDYPAELIFTPWRVTRLLIEALRGRAARRGQTHVDGLQLNGEVGGARRLIGQQRLAVNPMRAATVWLNCWLTGPRDQNGKFVVRVNGHIVQSIKARTETCHLIKVDLQDVVSGQPANVCIELETPAHGTGQQCRVAIIEALVNQEDFVLIPEPTDSPAEIPVNQSVSFASAAMAGSHDFLGFGWRGCDPDGVQSSGELCELEFSLVKPVANPTLTFQLRRTTGRARKQNVLVSVNGAQIAALPVPPDKFETIETVYPGTLHGPVVVRLELEADRRRGQLTLRELRIKG